MGLNVSRTSTCSVTLPPSLSLVVSVAEWITAPGLLILALIGLVTVVQTISSSLSRRPFRLTGLRRPSWNWHTRIASSWPRFLPPYSVRSPRRVADQSPSRRIAQLGGSPRARLAAAVTPTPPGAYAILAPAENPPPRLVTALRRYQAGLRATPCYPRIRGRGRCTESLS